MVAADGALGVAANRDLVEGRVERVEEKEAAGKRLADAEGELQHLARLERADDARQDAEDATFRAARRELRRRRAGVEAAVARPVLRVEDRHLALEAVDRPVDDGDPVPHRGVVHEVAGREVVRPVEDHVPAVREDPLDVLGVEPLLEGDDRDVGVERLDRALRRVDLRLAEPVGRVDDLALEVRVVDDVRVDDPDRPYTRRSEVEGGGRAEAAGADQQHAGVEQALLALLADLWDQQVAPVARPLRRRERGRHDDLVAVPLPAGEAVREVDHILVAERVEVARRERRARAALAVDDELPGLVRDQRLDT